MSTTIEPTVATHLLGYLTKARWFAGKGRTPELVGVRPLPWLHEPGSWPAVRFEVAEVRYRSDAASDPGSAELYQLAVSYWPEPQPRLSAAEIGPVDDHELGPVRAHDAMQDPAACRLVLQRLLKQSEICADGARVGFHLVAADALSTDLEPRMHTGQQSNTSVMYGETAMLKLFRRLELGHNLDIEVHESLSRSGVGDVARLYGWVEASWPAGSPGSPCLTADLAMVVEKLPQAQDGWDLALDTIRSGDSFATLAADLGRALAEIHAALRRSFPTSVADGQQIAEVMSRRLADAASIAPTLQPHLVGLQRCFRAISGGRLATQRVHGDFHLGQTLFTPGGWKIIDFEGEPVKSLAERSEPDSVWRDIAGMLRSFDYAAASVPGPDSRTWAEDCRTSLLQGYLGRSPQTGEEAVLNAYLADKAVYEVVYETRNRPDWVDIPLGAIEAIASPRSTESAPAEQVKE